MEHLQTAPKLLLQIPNMIWVHLNGDRLLLLNAN
jgi:hypothetical protein